MSYEDILIRFAMKLEVFVRFAQTRTRKMWRLRTLRIWLTVFYILITCLVNIVSMYQGETTG